MAETRTYDPRLAWYRQQAERSGEEAKERLRYGYDAYDEVRRAGHFAVLVECGINVLKYETWLRH